MYYLILYYYRRARKFGVKALTIEKEMAQLHPSSVNEKQTKFPSPYLIYYLKRKSTGGIFLFDTTSVSPMALVFASRSTTLGTN